MQHHSLRTRGRALWQFVLLATASLILSGLAPAQDGAQAAQSGNSQSPVQKTWVLKPSKIARTLPLYQMHDQYVSNGFHDAEEVKVPSWITNQGPVNPNFRDQALQTTIGPMISVTQGLSFDGIGEGLTGPNGTYSVGSVPPDTDMAAGTTQVVSLDNSAFAVFDKSSGAILAGPYNTNVLWQALGSSAPCYVNNDGDGVVKFDQLAQRWLITQFSVSSTPYAQCVAISQTADATGAWTVLQFTPSGNGYFPDYPKMGVWTDAYSFTFDMFTAAGSFVAGGICGMDRVTLLNGGSPTVVCAQLAGTDYALLPVDIDGPNYPASGAKEIYLENSDAANTSTVLYMYRAKYNFTAGTVAVDARTSITVSQYSNKTCTNIQKCVPQPTHTGTVQNGSFASESKLDTLAAHEMFRAAYRNFGTYESVLLSGPVLPSGSGGSGSNTAERWYELRGINTSGGTGTPTVYQQSTFSPDTSLFRWMGSIAQDNQGNMLMGYSGSSSTVFPSIYITGRVPTDSLSTMESESQVYAGLNSQVNLTGYLYGYRWGDYTSMMMDPNDCTFWYTGEYLKQAGLFNWSTRVLSFTFPGCTSLASITQPIPNSTVTSGSATFLWMPGTGSPSYTLSIGSTQGGNNYCGGTQSYPAGTYSAAFSCLPTGNTPFWVRLTTVGGANGYQDYQYNPSSGVATTTSVSSSANPSTYNQAVIFTATVTSGSGTPTGTVQFVVDSTNFGTPVAVNGSGQAISNPTTTLTVGTHSVVANYTPSGSYLASSGSLTQTVNKATQTITFTTNAPASATYGTQFAVAATGGGSGNPVTFTSSGACTNSGATYTMTNGTGTCSVIANQAGNTNYLAAPQVTENTTAVPAALTVTATSTAITYGCGCSPVLAYTMTGFIGTDNQGNSTTGQPSESTTGTQGAAGTFPINIGLGTLASSKYTFSFVNGVLTVNPATLTVTADNKTATEGNGLPTFTASYSGFVNGDNQSALSGSPAFSTDAPAGPPVGTWNIIPAQGTLAAANYVFTYVNGTLTVSAAVAQITAPPKNSMFSGSSVNFTWSHETNAVSYTLNLGTTPGAQNIASVTTANLNTTINGLPTDGSYIYATLLGSTDGINYTVEDTATYNAYSLLAVMVTPTPGSTFSGTSVTFTWNAGAGSSAYWLDVGSTQGGNQYYQSGNLGNVLTATVNNLPTDGSPVYVTLWSYVGGSWMNNQYTYTAYSNASTKGVMQTPTPGSSLSGSSVAFTWSAGTQSTAYWLDAGSTPGGNQYYQSGNLGNVLTTTANGLPTNGSTVYVTLWSLVNNQWVNNQYTYTAYNAGGAQGQMTSPTPGSTFTGPTETFTWTAGTGASAYWLDIGNVPGGNQYYQSGNLGNVLTTTVNGLPTNGSTVYVTLYSYVGGQWLANAYTYTAFNSTSGLGVLQTPTPGSTLSGNQATFTWSAGTGASAYWMDIGTTAGGNDVYQSGNLGNVLTTTVYSLPANGSQIYVTLYSYVGGQWLSNAYTYVSGP